MGYPHDNIHYTWINIHNISPILLDVIPCILYRVLSQFISQQFLRYHWISAALGGLHHHAFEKLE